MHASRQESAYVPTGGGSRWPNVKESKLDARAFQVSEATVWHESKRNASIRSMASCVCVRMAATFHFGPSAIVESLSTRVRVSEAFVKSASGL